MTVITDLAMNDYDQRFAGLRRLYGDQAYQRLAQLHICVVGVGGVGSWAVEALARSGVGRITMIDFDDIALSNSNRQIHALTTTLDTKKTAVLMARVQQINPHCQCEVIDDFLTTDNYMAYLARGYDYVIDAIDSIKFKAHMIYYCKRNKIPIITTGGAGGRLDPTQIQVRDLSKTVKDPLAAKVRAKLRDDFAYTRNPKRYFGVECVFSSEQPLYPKEDGSVGYNKPGIHGVHLDCRFGYGTSVCVTAMFGFTAVARALSKLLLQRD